MAFMRRPSASGPKGMAGVGCIMLGALVIIALSIAIISINRRELYDVTTWCNYYLLWWPDCYSVAHVCWASSDPTGNMTACNYLYALAAIGLTWQCLMSLAPCLDRSGIFCTVVTALMNFGWWLGGGIYFTLEFNKMPANTPAQDYRNAIEGLIWTCFGMSVVQFASLGCIAASLSRGGGHDTPMGPGKVQEIEAQNAAMYAYATAQPVAQAVPYPVPAPYPGAYPAAPAPYPVAYPAPVPYPAAPAATPPAPYPTYNPTAAAGVVPPTPTPTPVPGVTPAPANTPPPPSLL